MATDKIFALLIEDDPDDVLFITEDLSAINDADIVYHCADSLKSGLLFLEGQLVDVLLLDLNLSDSRGMQTLLTVKNQFPDLPVIVLTGIEDETSGLELVHNGAQDYLAKGRKLGPVLVRSMRYAIERQRLLLELDTARLREREARELAMFERYSNASSTQVTALSYGQLPLRQSAPDFYQEALQSYADLLDRALEQYAFHIENTLSPGLRKLAEKMCFYRASARDVVELHTAALRIKSQTAIISKRQAYSDQGRLMLVELMGQLMMCYRNYYTGAFTGLKNKEK